MLKITVYSLTLAVVFSLPSSPTTVFSSFVSGQTYQCCNGFVVSGGSDGYLANESAAAFTPSGDFDLSQIDIAIYDSPIGGVNSSGFILSLDEDSLGVPGTTIETWTGLIAPSAVLGTSSLVITVMPVSDIELLSGNQYWIAIAPASGNTEVVWNLNGGPNDLVAGSYNNGVSWGAAESGYGAPAFDVLGTEVAEVPEPGTLPLMAFAFLGTALIVLWPVRAKPTCGRIDP